MMNFKQQLKIVKMWENNKKIIFLNKIAQNIPIGIRMIIAREELSSTEKVEAIQWINEFHHEINKISTANRNIIASDEDINILANYVKMLASKDNRIISAELEFCITDAFEQVNRNLNSI